VFTTALSQAKSLPRWYRADPLLGCLRLKTGVVESASTSALRAKAVLVLIVEKKAGIA
jgi:hypothetical protein